MNAESSRSHSIFQIYITQKNTLTGSTKTGKLSLVDLAGSEKAGKTGATGQIMEEAKKINKSLSSLGNVINSLTDGKSSHIPYRDSKLTRILQESLGGNSRTSLIINCSPSSYNEQETLSTLRFGVRAKSIKNNAKINTEISPAELKSMLKMAQSQVKILEKQVCDLGAELAVWRNGGVVSNADWTPSFQMLSNSSNDNLIDETIPISSSQQVIDLEDAIADKESKIVDLEERIDALEQELIDITQSHRDVVIQLKQEASSRSELEMTVDKQKFEIREANLVIEELKEVKVDLTTQIESLEHLLESTKTCTTDSSALEETRRELDESQSTIKHLTSALETVKEERSATSKRLECVQSTLAQVQQEYQQLLEQSLSPNSISDIDGGDHEESKQLDRQMQLQLEQQEQELVYLRDLVTHKDQEIGELTNVMQDQMATNNALKIALKEKSNIQQQQQEKEQEQAPLVCSTSKLQFLQSSLDQLTIVQKQLVTQNTQLKKEAGLMLKKLESRSERITRVESLLQESQVSIAEMEARFDFLESPCSNCLK